MSKHKFHFRTYASDETENWNLPAALAGCTAFGLYFFHEGEATHICSFEANSRVEFLENVFLGGDDPEAVENERQNGDLAYENGGEGTSYFGFIDVTNERTAPYIGPRESFVLDFADYQFSAEEIAEAVAHFRRWESPQKARALAERRLLTDHAYEVAREEFSANSPAEPPVLGNASLLFEHLRRRALRRAESEERYHGAPALFEGAGIVAPLATRPADLEGRH